MQKKLLIVFAILSLIFVPYVHAACTYKETADLNKEVANIKANYEVSTAKINAAGADSDELSSFDVEIFKVNILNLSERFYIKYSNNYNKDTKTIYSSSAINGVYSFEWRDLAKVTSMTFKVYSSDKTNCANELYRTIYLTLPRYNQYHDQSICNGLDNVSICDKYVTTEEISYKDFVKKLSSYNNGNNTNTNNNGTNNNGENTKMSSTELYILIGIAVVIVGGVSIALINRKRNQL